MKPEFKKNNKENSSYNSNKYGRWLANPNEGEEIVISGLAGYYPKSKNFYEFRDNLLKKVDMTSDYDLYWKQVYPQIPERYGRVGDIEKFDAGYFGIHEHQAHTLDPYARHFMERAIESIFDAGLNPIELEGTNTGIFVGVCFSETEKTWFYDKPEKKRFAITGCIRSMITNRLSYHLKLKGPSYITDTACSSSLYALENAYKTIREGKCDFAIVGGVNLCLRPTVTLEFESLGILSADGKCKVFDDNADGYVRSEGSVAIFLQKAKNARRIYCQVIHAKTNCNGYNDTGITSPSAETQTSLMKEVFDECKIDPVHVTFLEAHGTGTKIGDFVELNGIDEVFCNNNKKQLLIGSIKSNLGHAEAASGLFSVSKAIVAFETEIIPPNLHYTTPRKDIETLEKGRVKVVTEYTPLPDDNGLIGINSFGLGGANAHVLLKWNKKKKVNGGFPNDNLPRLVCISGREEDSITSILDDIKNRSLDVEYLSLYHQIFSKETSNHSFRGYSIVSKSGEIKRSFKEVIFEKKPLYLVFSNFSSHWKKIAKELFVLPLFGASMQKIDKILSKFEVNITDILLNADKKSSCDQILGTMAIQIGIIDLFQVLKIQPNGCFGYGLGELICDYFDGFLDLKEIVKKVYKIVSNLKNSKKEFFYTNGILLEPELHLSQCREKSNDIFTKSTKPFSRHLKGLKQNFENQFSNNAIILEVGNRQFSEKDFYENNNFIKFDAKEHESYFRIFLEVLGSLYEEGYNFELHKLYPRVEYPVSRGTSMISPLIKWNHKQKWFVTTFANLSKIATRQDRTIFVSVKDPTWQFITGHVIDGRNLFPATGYLSLALDTYSLITKEQKSTMQVIFKNCKFHQATNVPEKSTIVFYFSLQKGTGNFEINDGLATIVSGKLLSLKNFEKEKINLPISDEELDEEDMPLTTTDIYKELRLRGYNYSGAFQNIVYCSSDLTKAYIRWDGNLITFMDNMLQVKILQTDTRDLYVPTDIKWCSIDYKKHLAYVESFREKEPNLPVYIYKELDIIRCGGIEICGIKTSPIAKRKLLVDPVLEKYIFVPNEGKLDLHTLIRVNMQLALENFKEKKIKLVELLDDFKGDDLEPLSPIINEVINNIPGKQAQISILTKKQLDYPDFTIENKALSLESNCDIIVGESILQKTLVLHEAFGVLKENGFILTRESLEYELKIDQSKNIQYLTEFRTENEKFMLLRKKTELELSICIQISENHFEWISEVQRAMKNNDNIILYSQNEPFNGILGLINCLWREPDAHKIKCVFIQDHQAPPFDLNNNFYKEQLKKNLLINIYRNSQWGTYRHLLLNQSNELESEHMYVRLITKGDLTSFKFLEGPLTSKTILPAEHELIYVYYSALNFKDVMVATGRLNLKNLINSNQEEYVLGLEFAGCISNGKRMMGLSMYGTLSTLTKTDRYLMWEVPKCWSLAEAATVPVVYTTVIYCLFWEYKLKRGETVLIHSGAGGIGQAAIHIALHHGCTVYTTVGTKEKREFLKHRFPQLSDKHIGNSRDTSFEQMIFERTNGRGVDIVLNSLTEEKLLASVRCLANGGKFFEIGKFDFLNNNPLRLMFLEKNASFYGTDVDKYLISESWKKQQFTNLFKKLLAKGYIKPLNKNIFKTSEVEKAFRYMTTGKHIGKILIEIRKEENERNSAPNILLEKSRLQYHCCPNASYVIIGGLGGIGLELADWLILRGARIIILSSSKGLSNAYQSYRIKFWRSQECHIQITTVDITTKEGCKELIMEANKLAPIAGIFNLALVLKDALFENQNIENFVTSFGTKAFATKFLDEISRKLCPNLENFVVFSSVSCGRGKAGQTSYGMANSIMERICERRQQDGLPATAIQWGAIGDVGMVVRLQEQNIKIDVDGTIPQGISNCLEVLDNLLTQNNPIVSSIVIAEEKKPLGATNNMSIIDVTVNLIGIKNVKSIDLHSTLAELGMDSMTAIEIKQTFEREFEFSLTASDIRNLTFAKLYEIENKLNSESSVSNSVTEKHTEVFEMLLNLISDESTSNKPVVEHQTKITDTLNATQVIFLPGTEGFAKVLEPLTSNLHVRALVVQYGLNNFASSINELALNILTYVEKNISKTEPINIVGYSYGAIVGIEMVSILEQKGYLPGHLICIDDSPKILIKCFRKALEIENDSILEFQIISKFMVLYLPLEMKTKYMEQLMQCKTFEERIEIGSDILTKILSKNKESTKDFYRAALTGACNRIETLLNYKITFPKIKSKVSLFKAKEALIKDANDDYDLSELCENPIEIKTFKGNHLTILENLEMSKAIEKSLKKN